MEVDEKMFRSLTTDQKLDYIYKILSDICIRLKKVEKNKWWTRIMAMIAAGTGGAIVAILSLFK